MANIKSEEKLRTLNSNHLAPIVMVTHRTYKFLDIIWNESVPTVEMSWKEFAHGKDFRNGLTEGLDLLESKKSSNWLADLRQLGVVTSTLFPYRLFRSVGKELLRFSLFKRASWDKDEVSTFHWYKQYLNCFIDCDFLSSKDASWDKDVEVSQRGINRSKTTPNYMLN